MKPGSVAIESLGRRISLRSDLPLAIFVLGSLTFNIFVSDSSARFEHNSVDPVHRPDAWGHRQTRSTSVGCLRDRCLFKNARLFFRRFGFIPTRLPDRQDYRITSSLLYRNRVIGVSLGTDGLRVADVSGMELVRETAERRSYRIHLSESTASSSPWKNSVLRVKVP